MRKSERPDERSSATISLKVVIISSRPPLPRVEKERRARRGVSLRIFWLLMMVWWMISRSWVFVGCLQAAMSARRKVSVLPEGYFPMKLVWGLAFHDSETGEGFIGERGIRLVERGVGRHAEVISAGKNYIARGIVNTGDQSGCGVRAKGVAGGLEVGGGDGGDWGYIREGIVKGESGVYNGVV